MPNVQVSMYLDDDDYDVYKIDKGNFNKIARNSFMKAIRKAR